jgi:hypothetical protein
VSIAFLFGAGVSIPAKMPSTKDLTNEILNDYEKWCNAFEVGQSFQTVENYKKRHTVNLPNQRKIVEIGNFLNQLLKLLKKYNKNVTDITYEDIYDTLNQIHGNISENYKNPLIEPFVNELIEICGNSIDLLSFQSMKFIEDVIRLRLRSNSRQAVLSPLIKIINENSLNSIHIFTLNFDTLIEELLVNEGIDYCDGFTLPLYNNQVCLWQMESLMNNNFRVKLYKLHGSLDWERIMGGIYDNQFVKIINQMVNYPDFEFNGTERVVGCDTELMGIANKLLSYNYGIYQDMINLFNLNLKECTTLIISGYSFSDYGINLRIIDWMVRTKNSKIVFIDPFSEVTLQKSRGAIYSQFDKWKKDNKFIIINDKFENWNAII